MISPTSKTPKVSLLPFLYILSPRYIPWWDGTECFPALVIPLDDSDVDNCNRNRQTPCSGGAYVQVVTSDD
jgi:hypothetical protein